MLIQDQVLNLNGIDSSGGLEHVACTMIGGQDILSTLESTFYITLFDLRPPVILQGVLIGDSTIMSLVILI